MTGRARFGTALFVVSAMAVIAVQEAAVKLLTDHVSIWQLHVIRSVLVIGFALIAARIFAGLELRGLSNWRWPITRSVLFSSAFFLLYSGLPFLSLAQSAAVFFTGPLIITLFATLFLGERIGPRRIAALVLGFSGVLVTAQPWTETASLAILFPFAAAVCYAFGVMVTRGRCHMESALTLQVLHHGFFGVVSLVGLAAMLSLPVDPALQADWPFLLGGWSAFGLAVGALIVLNALTNFIGAFMLTHAYQRNEASLIAPLEYSYLAFAPLLDLAIWGTAPTLATLAGIVLVAGSGVFIAMREGSAPQRRA